jgi:hypothetical protein
VQAHILTFDYPGFLFFSLFQKESYTSMHSGYGCFSGNADMALVDKVMDRLVDFAENSLHWPLQNIILFGYTVP